MNHRTDSDLLHEYAENGSESAFAELVNRHIAMAYSAALRVVVDAHLAEDVAQGTFAILAKEARHLVARAGHTLRLVREDNQWFPVMSVWLHERPGRARHSAKV